MRSSASTAGASRTRRPACSRARSSGRSSRSEEHTSELQSPYDLVCRLLLETSRPSPPSTLFPYTTLFRSISDERTNVTYYNGVRVPDRYRVGAIDHGWAVIAHALEREHGGGFPYPQARMLAGALEWAFEQIGRAHV